MKFYLGVTDNNWFRYLSRINPEDVNFWQPGGNRVFGVLEPLSPFLFKLKSPLNAIGGVGFFLKYIKLPLSVAWDTFQDRNGSETFDELSRMILNHRKDKHNINPTIGCIVLTNPVFFRREDWIETPADWSNSIVQGKSYTTDDVMGKEIWYRVGKLLEAYMAADTLSPDASAFADADPAFPLYGNSIFSKVRIGQGAFRVLVTDAYSRRCSITGEKTLPVLEAAHIKPYASAGPHHISNGILLRSDIHKLFDSGYLTVTQQHRIEVSSRIKTEFQNGKEYYQYHGKSLLFLPDRESDLPGKSYIDWHNTHIYKD